VAAVVSKVKGSRVTAGPHRLWEMFRCFSRSSFEGLLQAFWRMIDPTDPDGQFVDRGKQYATAIFFHDEDQRLIAERSLDELAGSGRYEGPLVTPIRPATSFYAAADYHQDYHRRNGLRYGFYRRGSGRDRYLDAVWGDDRAVDFGRYSPSFLQANIQSGDG
jgi:peptide methionine sulfoxide reductase msrA/msrB